MKGEEKIQRSWGWPTLAAAGALMVVGIGLALREVARVVSVEHVARLGLGLALLSAMVGAIFGALANWKKVETQDSTPWLWKFAWWWCQANLVLVTAGLALALLLWLAMLAGRLL